MNANSIKMVNINDIPKGIIEIQAIDMALNGLIIAIDENNNDLAFSIDNLLASYIAIDTNYNLEHSIQELYAILEFCAKRNGGHVEYGYTITSKDFFDYHDANPSVDWAIESKKHLDENGFDKLDEPAYWMRLIKHDDK